MRKLLLYFSVIIFSIPMFGCSREEPSKQPLSRAPAVVKKPIAKAQAEKVQTETASVPAKGESSPPAPAPDPAQEVVKKVAPTPVRSEAGETQAKRAPEPVQKTETGQSPPEQRFAEKTTQGASPRWDSGAEGSTGFYVAKSGDTLAGIAAKKEVYGNRLKWPILYRLNAQALESLPAADHLPDLPLTDGMKLKIVTPEEAARNLEKRSGSIWVVNVLSATTNAEVIPAVISLIKNDYPVYVSTARVNDKDWMRVRVGFFRTKEEAEAEGKRIMQLLSLQDSWVTRLAKSEFSEFAGY